MNVWRTREPHWIACCAVGEGKPCVAGVHTIPPAGSIHLIPAIGTSFIGDRHRYLWGRLMSK